MIINIEIVLKFVGLVSFLVFEFCIVLSENGLVYVWCCDVLGVIVYGNS